MNVVLRHAGVTLGCLLAGISAHAQTTVNTPITIPLQLVTVGTGDNSYQKLGIWASIGGGQPGLFEFDTGGDGFFAVQAPGVTPWWGSAISPTGSSFTQKYSSGYVYTGSIVTGAVSVYASATAATPLLETGPGVSVGQTESIVNSPTTYWPPASSPVAPPVDSSFYGDFGVSLVNKGSKDSGTDSPTNIFAQLSYGPGVNAGFIVHTGPRGTATGAYVQVGITAADMAGFPIQIPIADSSASPTPFPVSGLPSYGLSVLTGRILLQLPPGPRTPARHALAGTPITLDTGNPTPMIYTVGKDVPAKFRKELPSGDTILQPRSTMSLSVRSSPATALSFLQVKAGVVTGVNKINVGGSKSTPSFNVGLTIFQQYDVAFNLTTGTIGLSPLFAPRPLKVKIFGKPALTVTEDNVEVIGSASGTGLVGVDLTVNGRPLRVTGTTHWRAAVKLEPGLNVVKVQARSDVGKTSQRAKVVITLAGNS